MSLENSLAKFIETIDIPISFVNLPGKREKAPEIALLTVNYHSEFISIYL
jgi:hypothetical protein